MTDAQFAAIIAAFETIDRRLVTLGDNMADSAASQEALAESLQSLQELYVALDRKQDENSAIVSNYIEETRSLRSESRNLHSLVRKKLEAG
jgi:predicted  nucleic acid-binding Zn-ribbon protein